LATSNDAISTNGPMITQRASVFTRPAKHPLGPAETIIGLGLFALAILGPSSWILANIEDYKKKD
uniref:Cytochrome c oxidase subunit 8B, mitochondrial-like n=1 Tax=Salmo trutta TaxID=8032 RepID=A0A674EQK3_SALTR